MMQLLLNAEVHAPESLGRRHLFVAGGVIAWIGAVIPAFPEIFPVQIIDLAGRALVPGFIDGHAHLTGGGGEAGLHTRVPPLELSRFTRGGITTVVGVLGTDDVTRDTAGLLATARGLDEQGLTAYCHCGGYHLPPVTLTGTVRGDIVHVERILGVGEVAISDHRSSQPTLDELLRIASEVHVAGMMTGKAGILHLHVGDGPRGLALIREALDQSELPPRVFNPTHVNRRKALFDEALELAARGCTIDVTAFPVADGEDAWTAAQALQRYQDAGLPPGNITISTDGGGCLPSFDAEGRVSRFDVGSPSALTETIHEWLAMGRPLSGILPAITSNVAALLRLPDKGRIAVGADADLVTLDQSGNIMDVAARGRWFVRDGKPVVFGTFERAS